MPLCPPPLTYWTPNKSNLHLANSLATLTWPVQITYIPWAKFSFSLPLRWSYKRFSPDPMHMHSVTIVCSVYISIFRSLSFSVCRFLFRHYFLPCERNPKFRCHFPSRLSKSNLKSTKFVYVKLPKFYIYFSITVQDVCRSINDSNELRSNVWNFSVSRIFFFLINLSQSMCGRTLYTKTWKKLFMPSP